MRALHFLLVLSALCLGMLPGWSAEIRQVDGGPIHEAFVAPITGPVVLDAISQEPPAPITEHIPGQEDEYQEWIPGYWAWSLNEDDFIWVTGVWRCTPPGKIWIPGFWKQFEEGWVWIRGFWSPQPATQLTFLAQAPPDALEEEVGAPPNIDQFWAPGYWLFNSTTEEYDWLDGAWDTFDPDWIYVPAHYVWRSEGWIFIPAYWDWPANRCGRAYACIWIPAGLRLHYVYEPIWILEPLIIIQTCYTLYPDYLYWCHHHWHYYPEFWSSCGCAPTWWHWDDWWCMSWHKQWAVWWWWSHPGYPHPVWLNKHAADLIAPPKNTVFTWIKHASPPPIVLPNGVVSPQHLLKTLNQVVPHKKDKNILPILPANRNMLQQVQNKALTKTVIPHNILKPIGKPGDWRNASDLVKQMPLQSTERDQKKDQGPRIQIPSKDLLPKTAPKIRPGRLKELNSHKKPIDPIRPIKPAIHIIETPPIHQIEPKPDSTLEEQDREHHHPIDLQKQQQERLQQLHLYQQQKQGQLQQRHIEKLQRIQLQQQQEQRELQNKIEQKIQWQRQKQEERLQQIQLRQREKQQGQQFKHQQKLDFERQKHQLDYEQQTQYLKQIESQRQQQERQQQDLQQLQEYRSQQEQQQQQRMQRLQHFRQPQPVQQEPYKPESKNKSARQG